MAKSFVFFSFAKTKRLVSDMNVTVKLSFFFFLFLFLFCRLPCYSRYSTGDSAPAQRKMTERGEINVKGNSHLSIELDQETK